MSVRLELPAAANQSAPDEREPGHLYVDGCHRRSAFGERRVFVFSGPFQSFPNIYILDVMDDLQLGFQAAAVTTVSISSGCFMEKMFPPNSKFH